MLRMLHVAGAEEMHAIAAGLGKLPARSVWKVSETELASVGGAASLNLSSNVKVGWPAATAPRCPPAGTVSRRPPG